MANVKSLRKRIALMALTACMALAVLIPTASALSLADDFVSWVNYQGGWLGLDYKQSCSSTEVSQNHLETYQGYHYLHNWVGTSDRRIAYVDTGRVYRTVGFTLRTDYTPSGNGTAYATYGTD